MTKYDPEEFQRHAREAADSRDLEEGVARVRTALFVAALGPLAVAAVRYFAWALPPWAPYAMVATAPLAFVLLVIAYARLPAPGRFRPGTLLLVVLTLAAAGATFPLMRHFSMI